MLCTDPRSEQSHSKIKIPNNDMPFCFVFFFLLAALGIVSLCDHAMLKKIFTLNIFHPAFLVYVKKKKSSTWSHHNWEKRNIVRKKRTPSASFPRQQWSDVFFSNFVSKSQRLQCTFDLKEPPVTFCTLRASLFRMSCQFICFQPVHWIFLCLGKTG